MAPALRCRSNAEVRPGPTQVRYRQERLGETVPAASGRLATCRPVPTQTSLRRDWLCLTHPLAPYILLPPTVEGVRLDEINSESRRYSDLHSMKPTPGQRNCSFGQLGCPSRRE